jgi:hypothetical protein
MRGWDRETVEPAFRQIAMATDHFYAADLAGRCPRLHAQQCEFMTVARLVTTDLPMLRSSLVSCRMHGSVGRRRSVMRVARGKLCCRGLRLGRSLALPAQAGSDCMRRVPLPQEKPPPPWICCNCRPWNRPRPRPRAEHEVLRSRPPALLHKRSHRRPARGTPAGCAICAFCAGRSPPRRAERRSLRVANTSAAAARKDDSVPPSLDAATSRGLGPGSIKG